MTKQKIPDIAKKEKVMKSHVFIGIYLFIVLLALCIIPIIVYLSGIDNEIVRTLVYVGASGGIGGTVYSIRGFYKNLGAATFKVNWIWWYVFRPMISVVAGVFVYFLLVGGLMSISNNADITFKKGVMFFSGLAFLAGYSFTRFMNNVEGISDKLFTKENEKNDNENRSD
jgi:hypothetical protein